VIDSDTMLINVVSYCKWPHSAFLPFQ